MSDENSKLENNLRERWWHEDKLISQRLDWLFKSQGLLTAGFAYLKYQKITFDYCTASGTSGDQCKAAAQAHATEMQHLMDFLACLGLFVCLIIFVGICAACHAQKILQKKVPAIELGIDIKTTNIGRTTALFFPCIGLIGWTLMLTDQPMHKLLTVIILIAFSGVACSCFEERGKITRQPAN